VTPDDNGLRDLLRDVPRESVSPDFRARVLARLDAADDRIRARRRRAPVLAFAAAFLVAAGTAGVYTWQQRAQARAMSLEQARLARIELEYRNIEQDFQELQRMVAAAQPVVGIEAAGERGYLVDLPELAKARTEGSVPVAYRTAH
jgi:hypothetical protein